MHVFPVWRKDCRIGKKTVSQEFAVFPSPVLKDFAKMIATQLTRSLKWALKKAFCVPVMFIWASYSGIHIDFTCTVLRCLTLGIAGSPEYQQGIIQLHSSMIGCVKNGVPGRLFASIYWILSHRDHRQLKKCLSRRYYSFSHKSMDKFCSSGTKRWLKWTQQYL